MAAATAMAATCSLAPAAPACSSSPSSSLVPLPARRATSFQGTALRLAARRCESLRVASSPARAASSEDSSSSEATKVAEDVLADLKEKWDAVDNKTTVALYGGGALVLLWLSSTIVGAINSVPLLPKIMELVGLSYTGWFVYRYLLFKDSRKELVKDVEELKGKITGATEE